MNSKLQLRRDQIEELSQVKNLLTKLQIVFDLPRRLRAALDRGAHEIAADAYADAASLLKRYGHKVGPPAVSTPVKALPFGAILCTYWACLMVSSICRRSSLLEALGQ